MQAFLPVIYVIALLMFASTIFRSIGLAMAFNPDALMIVCGGTIVAMSLGFPMSRLKQTISDVIDSFKPQRNRSDAAKDLLDIARLLRKSDIRSLEKRMKATNDDFLKMGVELVMSHQSNAKIRTTMEKELAIKVVDLQSSQNVLRAVSRLTPSFGLAGTVISLIKIFKNVQTIDTIAPFMAVAMMSTFYGVIISNLFMLPLCSKLEERSLQSEAIMYSIIEGIVAINDQEHPLRVEERVGGYREAEQENTENPGRLQPVKTYSGQ